MADKIKLACAALLVVAGVVGYYYLKDTATIVRAGSVVAGLIAASGVAWTTAPGKQLFAFAQESVGETKKVVWPTRKETLQTTGLVFVFIVLMALFLWLVDATLLWLVKLIMGRD
ncbi:MAG: preprotein translocase subunit SecE [Burkholderiales bacterium]|jgi:preprotein translocase subunit SecE|nr:preprotein translocase subunit SecE [Burkholderiales bacterium]